MYEYENENENANGPMRIVINSLRDLTKIFLTKNPKMSYSELISEFDKLSPDLVTTELFHDVMPLIYIYIYALRSLDIEIENEGKKVNKRIVMCICCDTHKIHYTN